MFWWRQRVRSFASFACFASLRIVCRLRLCLTANRRNIDKGVQSLLSLYGLEKDCKLFVYSLFCCEGITKKIHFRFSRELQTIRLLKYKLQLYHRIGTNIMYFSFLKSPIIFPPFFIIIFIVASLVFNGNNFISLYPCSLHFFNNSLNKIFP